MQFEGTFKSIINKSGVDSEKNIIYKKFKSVQKKINNMKNLE